MENEHEGLHEVLKNGTVRILYKNYEEKSISIASSHSESRPVASQHGGYSGLGRYYPRLKKKDNLEKLPISFLDPLMV